ncbi:MAG TPA: energy-coupling factor ABC transporter ATP-binding protein [Methylophilaceae bacterium]|nr:energy-coupling factor ABC transporter ATP-binding protein [Methylophilaceae bacterium]
MSLLQVRGLRKVYGARVILEIDELALERGRSYVLTGGNGAGKSTLLRILAGLEPAQLQSMQFDGAAVALQEICSQLAPRIMYLHQHPYLFSSSVAANVAFGLKAAGVPHRRQVPMIDEAMAWAGVQHLARIPPHKLSGGEKQRVALARARVINPAVLLLDEPTANLDKEARRQVAGLIRQMCDNNHCVVMATHDPELMAVKNSIILRLENAALHISRPAD